MNAWETDGYVLFGTLIDNNNTMAYNGAVYFPSDAAPDRLGFFLKDFTKGKREQGILGGWQIDKVSDGMMRVALATIQSFKEKEWPIKETTVPEDFISVDWVFVVYHKLQAKGIKARVFRKGRLLYDGPMGQMPTTEEELEPKAPCHSCGTLTSYRCSRCDEALCEDCGASSSPPNPLVEDHICEECWDTMMDERDRDFDT